MGDWNRALTPEEQSTIEAARTGAHLRYEGRVVPHRSCGIALAETFGRDTPAYQALRRGGITGRGECGTAVAGRLILGELLGDPDPAGSTTPLLQQAMTELTDRWGTRTGASTGAACNQLVEGFADFRGAARAAFCTRLAAETSALVAETLLRNGVPVEVVPLPQPPDHRGAGPADSAL